MEDGVRFFSAEPSMATTGNMHKMKQRKLYLNTSLKVFYCEGGQTQNQVAQRGCGVSISEDTQNPTGHSEGQTPLGGPCFEQAG